VENRPNSTTGEKEEGGGVIDGRMDKICEGVTGENLPLIGFDKICDYC